ncbi:hypothetical protein ACIRFH_02900 [Streptomyces sp. NPDC093586]|uniref:hypothetical protein n=1 Tax=Streptomyces sp. NPDC093586 TaxID=3366042 RepID=UPI00382BC1BA
MSLGTRSDFVITSQLLARVFSLIGVLLVVSGCQASSGTSSGASPGTSTHASPHASRPKAREAADLRGRVLSYTEDLAPDGPYSPPDDDQRARLAEGIGSLLEGDAREAGRLLAPLGLGVTRLTDTGSGRRYDEVAATGPGESARWGRLYLDADSPLRWSAQVPHPVSDRDTEELGVRLLERTPGGALVLAGAHRRAGHGDADVAHREDSAFHGIVLELQKRGVPGIQLHGFAESTTDRYDAVLSTGTAGSTPGEVSALADRMESRGLRICRGWTAHCPLEGTTNVQGRAAGRRHATFVHLELAPGARGDGPDTDAAADAVAGLLSAWASD